MPSFLIAVAIIFGIGMLIRWAIKKGKQSSPAAATPPPPPPAAAAAPSSSSFCSECGQPASGDAAFCANCGTKLRM